MQNFQDQFSNWLINTKREGILLLLDYLLSKTDFFSAPASTKYHGNREGGLLEHSVKVCLNLLKLKETFFFDKALKDDEIYISALLHDICKANLYKKFKRNVKNPSTGQWEEKDDWMFDDQFPAGHGEKSVIIIQKFIKLSDAEILAIRWHMGAYDDSAKQFAGSQALSRAMEGYPLVLALHLADQITSYIDNV